MFPKEIFENLKIYDHFWFITQGAFLFQIYIYQHYCRISPARLIMPDILEISFHHKNHFISIH